MDILYYYYYYCFVVIEFFTFSVVGMFQTFSFEIEVQIALSYIIASPSYAHYFCSFKFFFLIFCILIKSNQQFLF